MFCSSEVVINPLEINMGFWMMVGVFTLASNILLSVWDRCFWGFMWSMLLLTCVVYVHLSPFETNGGVEGVCIALTSTAFIITMYTIINNRR